MDWLTKLKRLAIEPSAFYFSVKRESAWTAFYALLAVEAVRFIVMSFSPVPTASWGGASAGSDVAAFVTDVLLVLVMAAVAHGAVKLFYGKGGFGQTFKSFAYADVLTLAVMIPFEIIHVATAGATGILLAVVIFAAFVWSIVLSVKGLRVLQGITTGRAIAAIILALVALFLVAFLVGFIGGMLGVIQGAA
jgi:hypothetical protein